MTQFHFSSKPQQIAKSAVSIAKKIFGELKTLKVLVLGKNQFSSVIIDFFKDREVEEIKIIASLFSA